MHIYAIGTIRKGVKLAVSGFVLMDTDDSNNLKYVTKEELESILEKNKAVKIENIKLSGGKLQGTYYSIDILPYIRRESPNMWFDKDGLVGMSGNNKVLALNTYYDLNIEYIAYSATAKPELCLLDMKKNGDILTSKYVYNIDEYKVIKCKTYDNSSDIPEIRKTANVSKSRDLNAEVKDKNIVWDLITFDSYMKEHNYSYEIQKTGSGSVNIYNIDNNCKNIHLPLECTSVTNLYRERPSIIESIIIPSTTYEIRQKSGEIGIRIKDIYVQSIEGISERYYRFGFTDTAVICGNVEFPDDSIIMSSFNNIVFENESVFKNKFKEIENSFKKIVVYSEEIRVDSTKVGESFTDIVSANDKKIELKLSRRVTSISNSFKDCKNIVSINLDNLTELCFLNASFNNLGIRKADLSNCGKLRKMSSYNFNACKELETLKLPECLEEIAYTVLHDTKINRIEFGKSIKASRIVLNSYENGKKLEDYDDRVIVFPDNITEYNTSLVSGFKNKYEFKGEVRTIGELGRFSVSDIREMQIPKTVTTLEKNTFSNAEFETFDSREIPLVSTIPKWCFCRCEKLHNLILGDNIRKIEEFAFDKCAEVVNLVVSDKVTDIEKNSLSKIKIRPNGVMYLVKGSAAHRVLCKRNIACVLVDSVEEAVELMTGEVSASSEREQSKFKLLLSESPDMAYIIEEKNKKYAKTLFILEGEKQDYLEKNDEYRKAIKCIEKYEACSTEEKINEDLEYSKAVEIISRDLGVKINKNKFKEASLSEIFGTSTVEITDSINKILENTRSGVNGIQSKKIFMNTVRLYTTYVKNDIRLYTNKINDWISCDKDIEIRALTIMDKDNCILSIKSNLLNSKMQIAVIIMGGKIQFMFAFDEDRYNKTLNVRDSGLLTKSYTLTKRVSTSETLGIELIKYLNVGDSFSGDNFLVANIGGCKIPNELNSISTSFKRSLRLIGIKGKINKLPMKENTKSSKTVKALFYDTLSGKLVECITVFILDINGKEFTAERVGSIVIQNIYELEDIGKIDKEYFRAFVELVSNKSNNDMINIKLESDEDKIRRDSDMSNFDMELSNIAKLADMLWEREDKTLSANGDIVKELVEEAYFLNDDEYNRRTLENAGDLAKLVAIAGGESIIKVDNGREYVGIFNGNTRIDDKTVFRLNTSKRKIEELWSILKLIGKNRRTINKSRIVNYVGEEAYDRECLIEINKVGTIRFAATLGVGLDIISGDTYIFYREDESEANYIVYRFKNLRDALYAIEDFDIRTDIERTALNMYKKRNRLGKESDYNTGFRDLIVNGLTRNRLGKESDYNTGFRDLIVNGITRDIDVSGENSKLFKALAKQPKTLPK